MKAEEKQFILENVMPCGLICRTCTGCGHGVTKEHAAGLLRYLDGYEVLLEKNYPADMAKYSTAIGFLKLLAGNDCPGCRSGKHRCTYQDCVIRACTAGKGYDFCSDCGDFPCERVNESRHFTEHWIKATNRIREVGAAQFFDEERDVPHYIRFKPDGGA